MNNLLFGNVFNQIENDEKFHQQVYQTLDQQFDTVYKQTPCVQGNPVCRCLPGFVPMPDTIQGCKHECDVDRDCGAGNICDNYRSEVMPAVVLSNTHC